MNKVLLIFDFHNIISFLYTKYYRVIKIYYNKKKKNRKLKKFLFFFKYSKIKFFSKSSFFFKKFKKKKEIFLILKINYKINLFNINKLILLKKKIKIIFLDKLTDINNIGSCLRSSGFFNIDLIIYFYKKSFLKIINSKTYKISSGSITPILFKKNIIDSIFFFKKKNFIIISVKENSKINLFKINRKRNLIIIFGSESSSFKNKKILQISDYILSIPSKGNMINLNVSIACSIFLYEISL